MGVSCDVLALAALAALLGIAAGGFACSLARWLLDREGLERPCALPRARACGFVLALAWASLALRCGGSFELIELALFSAALVVLSATDFAARLIPNACVGFAAAVRVAYLLLSGQAVDLGRYAASAALLGGLLVLVGLLCDRLLGRDSIGWGDVKLLSVAASYFGLIGGLLVTMLSCMLGVASWLFQAVRQRRRGSPGVERAFAWGPAISASCWLAMLAGPKALSLFSAALFG